MAPDARSRFNQQVYEEACEWFVECRSGDLDQRARRELDRWLRKSPEHLSAYLEIAAIWNEGPHLDARHEWDSARLVNEARQGPDNVVLLSEQPETPTSKGAGVTRRGLFALAASLAVFCAGALSWYVAIRALTYSTDVGEQRSIVLTDGSTVDLNALSRVKIRYSEQERAVDLIEGQALFRVAKDAQRPFIVTSGRTRVRAVGTQFDVYKKRSGTIVTVVEGRVAILTSPAAPGLGPVPGDSEQGKSTSSRVAPPGAMLLSAGEQATVTPDAARKVDRPNVASATAWTQRQLVFDSASLAEVVEEFNRYNPRPLVIERADLYDFHISGVFSSTDPTSLVSFLRQRVDVEVVETPAEIRVTKKVR